MQKIEMRESRAWRRALGAVVLANLAMAGTLPLAGQAIAAQPGADAADAGIEEIVVSARRRAERLVDVPVAATAITPLEIQQYDMTSVANIKLVAPQISLDRGFTGSGSSISMRGVSSSSIDAGVEQSVLLDFDGMAISRGRILNDALFDMAGIDVLKGPQALFFGKNSPGGVVSVKSANPTKTLEGFARLGYEFNADTSSLEAAISGPLSDNVGFRVAMLSSDSKGYRDNLNSGVQDLVRPTAATGGGGIVPAAPSRLGAEEKLAARLTLRYDNNSNFDATFKLLGSRYRGQGIQSFSEVMSCPTSRVRPGTIGGLIDPTGDCQLDHKSSQGWIPQAIIAKWPEVSSKGGGKPYSANDTILPTLTLNYKVNDITLTSVTGYYDYDYSTQGNADATSYSYYWSYSNEKNKSFYQEFRAVSAYSGMFNFALGGHYEKNTRTLYVGGVNGPIAADAVTGKFHHYDNQQHNSSDAYSLFGQILVKLTPTLELAGGGRFSEERKKINTFFTYVNSNVAAAFLPVGQAITGEKKQHNFSPEATLTWHLNPDSIIYGAYKTGYLSGGFSNPGVPSKTSTAQNLSFDAEKAKGFEVGYKASMLNGRLNTSVTGYRYKYEGLPLTSLIALAGNQITYITQNAASTITQGLELEASYRPMKGLTLRGSASYNDAKFEDFQKAQCYTLQTAADGCVGGSQDLSNKTVYRAPKTIFGAGVMYEFNLNSGYRMALNGDFRRTSGYYTGLNLNPLSYQKGFTTFNAGVRVSTSDDKWSVAVIGRNLTDRHYGTLGIDKPGGAGEVFTVAGEPRAVVLQLEGRF